MKNRTVTVELLRAGPPHNQLLSPLTPYLGVCGESGAGVVHVPYEQYKFDRRLRELRYDDESGTEEEVARRLELLRETGAEMAGVLGGVPGLAGELRRKDDDGSLLHLRLVISASELALLPWELARVPSGTGIPAESWLLLQGLAPVTLTRHIRSVPTTAVRWPSRLRLLVITGDPAELPYEEHLGALQRAFAPWLPVARREDGGLAWPPKTVILENATVREIERACGDAREAGEPFTHVHVLAHGAEGEEAGRTSFGLYLSDGEEDGGYEVVSGERFATAVAGDGAAAGTCPAVVTLASCDSANQGAVDVPGSSFAHTLHEAGIPLVVASQFPLSMDGSVALVERLYSGLAWGENAIGLLHRIRTELHSRFTNRSHDWASLVVYEALPPDLDDQLAEVVYVRTKAALDAALKQLEATVERGGRVERETLVALAGRVEQAQSHLPSAGSYAMEALGLRAAAHKRLAQVEHQLAVHPETPATSAAIHLERCHGRLAMALRDYQQAASGFLVCTGDVMHRKATLHWVLVQAASLAAVLGDDLEGLAAEHWAAARLAAERYLDHREIEERVWAHGSLAELWLLRTAAAGGAERADAAERARRHISQVARLTEAHLDDDFPILSTRRQLARYVDWWGGDALSAHLAERGVERAGWGGPGGVLETARSMVGILDSRLRSAPLPELPPSPAPAPPAGEESPSPAAAGGGPSPRPARSKPGATPAAARPAEASPRRLGGRSRKRGGGTVFTVDMLPADFGDCLWIEYGDANDPSRVLIDCGPPSTFPRLKARVEALAEKDRRFELFVLTHIDNDHIGGTIPFFADQDLGVEVGDVWFNGWRHLPADRLNARQAEIFSTLVRDRKLPWNQAAGGGPLMVGRRGAADELPEVTLPGGLELTLLSPTKDRLARLRRSWEKELREHGLTPGSKVQYRKFLGGTRTTSTDVDALAESKFKSDNTPPNGSSIAFLAEFEGRAAVFAADTHVPVMIDSIKTLIARRGGERLRADLFKVSHHASQANTSSELIQLMDCPRWLISTSGARFHHPDRETVSRLIKHGGERPELCFNYLSRDSKVWAREDLQERYGYRASFPEDDEGGYKVSLL